MNNSSDNSEPRHLDSCQYSLEVSKLFIALAIAGIGFISSQFLSNNLPYKLGVYTLIFFGLSVAIGLLFLMSVVGHINLRNNYNVYSTMLRILAVFQIVFFATGIILISVITFNYAHNNKVAKAPSNLVIKINNKEIQQPIYPNSDVRLEMKNDSLIVLEIKNH